MQIMSLFRRCVASRLLLAPLVLLLWAGDAQAEEFVFRGATMGTTYQIKFVAQPAVDLERLHADVETVLAEIDRQMSTYRPDSELSRFNRAPAGEWFPVSAATAEVVAAAQQISEQTGGALDVTVGPLVRLWHFGPPEAGDDEAEHDFQPPADEEIRVTRQRVGYQKLHVRTNPPALRKDIDGLEVDLNSIAKGYGVDRLAGLFLERGIKDVLVEVGGEIRAAGTRPDGQPWRVAIQKPIAGQRETQRALPLNNAAMATSGDYQQFFEHAGRRYSHIIDPSTGQPVDHTLASITVLADDCMTADGWSTPLLVLGADRGYECAEQHGIAALFISQSDGGAAVRATSVWRSRFGE